MVFVYKPQLCIKNKYIHSVRHTLLAINLYDRRKYADQQTISLFIFGDVSKGKDCINIPTEEK
jgi:hypothetical protein